MWSYLLRTVLRFGDIPRRWDCWSDFVFILSAFLVVIRRASWVKITLNTKLVVFLLRAIDRPSYRLIDQSIYQLKKKLSIYRSIHPWIYRSFYRSIHRSIHRSIYRSAYRSIRLLHLQLCHPCQPLTFSNSSLYVARSISWKNKNVRMHCKHRIAHTGHIKSIIRGR